MTIPQATPEEPKKKNYLLWGCLIILVLMCLVIGCLVTVAGLSIGGIDPLGLNLESQINKLKPWQDYYYDPSSGPSYEDKDLAPDDAVEGPSIDSGPDIGFDQLVPFYSDNFTFSFFYPEGWLIEDDDYSERVNFHDLDSNNTLSVGKDWLCQGCSTAADVSIRFMDNLQMESTLGTFVVLEDSPYIVPTGEDASYSVMEWDDLGGNYMWTCAVNIYSEDPVEDMNIYFIMWGDDPDTLEMQRELLEMVVESYSKKIY